MKTKALKSAGLMVALAMVAFLPLSAQTTTGGRLNIHGTATTVATPTEGTTTIHTTTATPITRTKGTKVAMVKTAPVKAKPTILATKPN